jgi:signal transduction histidine kinase/streptogramin lyase
LPSNTLNGLQRDIDGSLLIDTHAANAHLRDGRITADLPLNYHTRKTYISPGRARWEISAAGLRKTRDGREALFPLPFKVSPDSDFNAVQMDETEDGALWLTAPGALYRLDTDVYKAYTHKDGLPRSFITAIAHDRGGGVWLATDREGVCRFANPGFTCYTTAEGLTSNDVNSVFQDREGTIWAGANDRGLNRLSHRVVTTLSAAAGLREKNVYSVIEDKAGDLWVGASRGLAQMRSNRVIRFFNRSNGLIHQNVRGLYQDRAGRLWIGSEGGIMSYADGRFTDFTSLLKLRPGQDSCWFAHQDAAGALWFGTDVGLLRYQAGEVRRYTVADGLPGNDVRVVHEQSNGVLWVGTYAGLARWDATRFAAWTERDGLPSNHIRALHEDERGTLWIGTYDGGLARFRDGVLTNFTTEKGLFSDGVFHILEDGRGNFWMGSNQGIYRVNRGQLDDVAAGRIATIVSTAFGRSDGMLNAECNGGGQTAGVRARDGKLLFPTQDGVAVIDPEAVPYNPLPPSAVIESAFVEGRTAPLTPELRLKPNMGDIEIRYTGLSLVKSEQVRFRYMLEGLETQWVEAGARRSAFYPYLPPGHYIFRVKAANSDLVWSKQATSLAITVFPPFYRTWWFLSLVFLLAVTAAWLAWRRRIARYEEAFAMRLAFSGKLIESQEAERKRMAGELHDSLGQHLLVIKNRAAMGARVSASHAQVLHQAAKQFDEIITTASQAIDEVRQIAYNLRPVNLDRLGLTSVIEELIEKVDGASGIRFSAGIMPLDASLNPDGAINLYRIIQESINNIVKHSHATRASVEIWLEGGEIHVAVSDDGCGFNAESLRRGIGLTSIAERVRILGGAHSVASASGRGTRLTIRIPITQLAKESANGA